MTKLALDNRDYKKLVTYYGLVLGLLSICIGLVSYIFNIEDTYYIEDLLYVILLFFALKDYKNNHFDKPVILKQIFRTGFWIIFIAAIISTLWNYLSYFFLYPDLVDKASDLQVSHHLQQIEEEELDTRKSFTQWLINPFTFSLIGFLWNIIKGCLYSLVISILIIKNKK